MKHNFTFFWKNRSPFTNWYPSKFTCRGYTYTCGEQYMMHQKALMFSDISVADAIMLTNNPKEHKDLGRLVGNYIDHEWAKHRVAIMVEGLYEKFIQNPKLSEALLATGNTIIAEASPFDKIWGIGLKEDDIRAIDQSKWLGLNLLGIVLMKVRDKLRNV